MAKVAFLFHLCCGLVSLSAIVGLWQIADRVGTRRQIESFLGDLLGTKDFQLFGDKLFRAALGGTGALILLATVGTVVMAFLYNMLSGIFGGVVVSVLQERVPLPRDVKANEDAAQAELTPVKRRRRRRRSRRGRKLKSPMVGASPLVYEPALVGEFGPPAASASGLSNSVASDSVVSDSVVSDSVPSGEAVRAGALPHGLELSGDAVNMWAPEPADRPGLDAALGVGGDADSSAAADDWIAAASDPTGSWMTPGARQ